MHDVTRFTLRDMSVCSRALRGLHAGAASVEEVAQRIVQYLYANLGDGTQGGRACALVRFYKTHGYGDLPPELQLFALRRAGVSSLASSVRCLTLLASVGDEPEWNDRRRSVRYQAIPFTSAEAVAQLPMFSQLMVQFGLDVGALLMSDSQLLMDGEQQSYNVFYVAEAAGSPYVPAQDSFVVPYGIRTVIGFGSLLPTGDMMTVILFLKVAVPRETADFFRTFALSAKLAVLPLVQRAIFMGSGF